MRFGFERAVPKSICAWTHVKASTPETVFRIRRPRRDMLRITVKENASEQRWIFDGRLTDCSVAEVLSNWHASRDQQSAGRRAVDLDGLTSIDRSGERVLTMM